MSTASSLLEDTLRSVDGGSPSDTGAGLSSRRENTSGGWPSQSAL
jgi:hypothetical protein